jgi:hypothetical protein
MSLGSAQISPRAAVAIELPRVSAAGIHVYNRDGMTTAPIPYDLCPRLDLLKGDALHAFYMGVELGRAQIAWQLGKRHVQDEPLKWSCAVRPAAAQDTREPVRRGYDLEGRQ